MRLHASNGVQNQPMQLLLAAAPLEAVLMHALCCQSITTLSRRHATADQHGGLARHGASTLGPALSGQL